MNSKLNTQDAIEDLIAAACGETATARGKHVYRQALLGLVRLAKSEQMLEIKTNIDRGAGAATARAARRYAEAILLEQRLPVGAVSGQTPLEFNRAE